VHLVGFIIRSFVPVTREWIDVMTLLVIYLFKMLRRVSKGLYDEN